MIGESMLPFLKPLDECICAKIDIERLKPGDLIVFEGTDDKEKPGVHRVIAVDKKNKNVITKGDNTLFKYREIVPFPKINEKVIAVNRGRRYFDLCTSGRSFASRFIAWLSRLDLTPGPFKKRFVDPTLLALSRNPLYKSARKHFYEKMSFMTIDRDGKHSIYVFVGRSKSATIVIEKKGRVAVILDSYIRYRDRNAAFAEKLIKKLLEISDEKFGPGSDLCVTGTVLKEMVISAQTHLPMGRIKLPDGPDSYPVVNFSAPKSLCEERLMFLLARTRMSADTQARVLALMRGGPLDWDRFFELLELNQMTSLVYKNLVGMADSIPEDIIKKLRYRAGAVFACNSVMLEHVSMLAERFSKEGKEVLFIKGVPLLMDVYKDECSREFSDIDIFVREKDIAEIGRSLESEGFKHLEPCGTRNDHRSQRVYSKYGKIFIDVHKGFIGRFAHDRMLGIDHEEIFRNKRKVEFKGREVNTLDLVHDLLYQCLHISMNHSFSGVKLFVDINEFVTKHKHEIDWGMFLEKAGKYRVKRPLYHVLRFTSEVFGAPVPIEVLSSLGTVKRKLDKWAFRRLKSKRSGTDYLAELFMFDSTRDAIKFIFLSFLVYPYLAGHFMALFVKILTRSK